jgi:sugar phosphate isomerase/epimerase
MRNRDSYSRRDFIRTSGALAGTVLAHHCAQPLLSQASEPPTKVSAHIWVYASKYPPNWDATPDLDRAFSDLKYAGFDGVELMEVNLRHDDAVEHIAGLSKKHGIPVTGCSYGASLWDAKTHDATMKDIAVVVPRLSQLHGKTFGISVGDAKRPKTDAEFDAQAAILKEISALCASHGIVPNLHNHTYEVANGMHDLKGTLARLPDFKLGPDLNWLVRGGVDPVTFINTYAKQIVYMHLRDQYADGTWTEYLGQGVTNFPAIAAALRANHFKGRAAVELAFESKFVPTQPLRETWKRSRDCVRTAFGW